MTSTAPPSSVSSRSILVTRPMILALGLLLLTRGVTGRFTSTHEWNSADWTMFARNHVEYGLGYTKLFCTRGDTADPPAEPQRYLNHPPLLAVWVAVPLWVFGDHEWAGRLVPIAATLGSAWILMVMVGRLHSPLLSWLTGLFYVAFPAIAYFGRMICHEAPVQFFSLLMLHGYVQWAGLYGNEYRRSTGRLYFTLGAVLGIGTGWAAVIMAGLIWIWQVWRVATDRRDPQEPRRLLWITLIPAVALTAVVVHILWGLGWDFGLFGPLFRSRTAGLPGDKPIALGDWLTVIAGIALLNYTIFGLVAAVLYVPVVATVLRWTTADSPFRKIVRGWTTEVPILLTALQGLIWMAVFKRQSYIHEYWQFYLAPFFALAMAAAVLACYTLLSRRTPRLAACVAALLMLAPMPLFARSLDNYHQSLQASPERVEALVQLAKLVPPRGPVMTSMEYPLFSELFGSVVSRFAHPIYAYYAHRPLIYSIDPNEILANLKGCSAYLLELSDDPKVQQLARQLANQYKYVQVGQYHLVFDLRKPRS